MTKNFSILSQKIIELSNSKVWDIAKTEWIIINSFLEKNNTCLCSHYPITEIIEIENTLNGNKAIIGNCCINRFFGKKDYNKFFKGLKEKRINQMIIDISYNKKIINDWERKFITDVWRKRKPSPKQIQYKKPIIKKIFENLKESDFNEKSG